MRDKPNDGCLMVLLYLLIVWIFIGYVVMNVFWGVPK